MNAFALRDAARKLDFSFGDVIDNGVMFEYVRYPYLGDFTAVVTFSGNYMPANDIIVALKKLSFTKSYSPYGFTAVPLKEVPPTVLSEFWNDYHEIAKPGQFDPDWENKIEW